TRKGFFPEGSRILYAHLGGAPAINGYSYYYKDDGGARKGAPRDDALPPLFP
ncbi:MAG: aminocyclopropane-1-carboxylate deaminase/D-cysteine desulfhydrase family protein, partial [Mesorhizobium sp.]